MDDLLQSHTARTMLANSEFIVILNQASTDRMEGSILPTGNPSTGKQSNKDNRIQRGIRQAAFPVIKALENFDFKVIPSLNKPKVLKLMQGNYIQKKENIILVGSSGVGKTHIAIALGYEACRQGFRVKFYTAAGLINELLAAQQEYRLSRLEKQWLIVLFFYVREIILR